MEKRVLISLYRKMPLNWASLTEQREKNLSPVSQLRIGTYLVALQTSPLERHSLEQGILHTILPRLLQRSKECRGHNSTLYHDTSQCMDYEK